MPERSLGRTELVSQRRLGVDEASAVAALADDTFLVVSDELGLCLCRPGHAPVYLKTTERLEDPEGMCLHAGGSAVFVLSEHSGSVWRFPFATGKLSAGEHLGRLPRIGDVKNRGWEGIDHVAAGVFGEADTLVAVHQTKPRRIGLFDPLTLAPRVLLKLPKQAKRVLEDLNDVTVDPVTHHLLVLSGKAGWIAALRLIDGDLDLVCTYPVETAKGDVPEGITFDRSGRLWVVTDGKGLLRELRLAKSGG
jgi:uncharacterized protein YjiK